MVHLITVLIIITTLGERKAWKKIATALAIGFRRGNICGKLTLIGAKQGYADRHTITCPGYSPSINVEQKKAKENRQNGPEMLPFLGQPS